MADVVSEERVLFPINPCIKISSVVFLKDPNDIPCFKIRICELDSGSVKIGEMIRSPFFGAGVWAISPCVPSKI